VWRTTSVREGPVGEGTGLGIVVSREEASVLDPSDLYAFEGQQPTPEELGRPALVFAFSGFVDAGSAVRLAVDHLLAVLPHRVLAAFDLDQFHDYRAQRPPMVFVQDHWQEYRSPSLLLHEVTDPTGTPFLLLSGPEPDIQWERFVAAVRQLVEHYRVRVSVGLQAIPMAVPHTRPCGLTAHATRRELVEGHRPWVRTLEVPGNVCGLLELRLGEVGHDAAGFAVHVPHYLAQAEYPDAAVVLLDATAAVAGLVLPTGELRESGNRTRSLVEQQVRDQPEVATVVSSLEEQYDTYLRRRAETDESGTGSGLDDPEDLPSAEELGAELERFLAEENRRQGPAEG
jgi:hypothetical protein